MRWSVVMLGLLCAACLPRVPKQRLSERGRIAVAYIVEPAYAGEPFGPPAVLKERITKELDERNLEVEEVPLEAIVAQRLTDSRFLALKARAPGAQFFLLVEQRVHFFSQLDGRYRWEVATTLTAARADGSRAQDQSELPVILVYDHEKEREAIATASSETSDRVGVLLDGVMAGAEVAPQSAWQPRGIYFVMVDRFENGDPSNDGDIDLADPQTFHSGDLKGLINRLDWIASMGFDTVWLSPVFEMRTQKWHGYGAFHGYWTWNLNQLEPRFGEELLLAQLRAELDQRGMKLLLDVVLNHVGPEAPLVSERPDWFHGKGGVTDWSDAQQLVTHDVHGLPDLATGKPEVFDYLVTATRRWLHRRPA